MYGNTAINYNYAFESFRISILIKTSDEKQTVEAHTYTHIYDMQIQSIVFI